MADMLQRGAQWLSSKMTEHASRTVTYTRGGIVATVPATVGRTLFKLGSELGNLRMQWGDRDYLITAFALQVFGITLPPQRGDVIADPDDPAGASTYKVLSPGDEPPWRWSDNFKVRLRIHCKQMSTVQ